MRSLFLNAITPEVAKLCLYYGGCLAAVVVALVVIGCIKRKTKKEMRAETVKKPKRQQSRMRRHQKLMILRHN